jgi:transcriptional/translational regulatory protein YebC/TACO1
LVPNTTITLNKNQSTQTLKLLDDLEDLDDVQKVFTNADFDEEALTSYAEK